MAFFKNQLRSIVQWDAPATDVLFELYQDRDDELKNKSTLIIQPGQGCLLVYEGKVKDSLTIPGSYNIQTDNVPFITTLVNALNSFESKHKTALYFFKTLQITGANWGTADTIQYVDPVYKIPVGITAFGNYTFSFRDALFFFENFIGVVEQYRVNDLEATVNQRLAQPLVQILASAGISVLELDKQRMLLSQQLEIALNDILEPLGLTLNDFRVAGMNYDAATGKHIQKIAEVGADLYNAQQTGLNYEQMQKMQALRESAVNEGGTAGIGAGAGVGMIMAQEMMKQTTTVAGTNDAEARLTRLQGLFSKQLITEQEYQQRKQEILKEI